jgi:hypothetical protein
MAQQSHSSSVGKYLFSDPCEWLTMGKSPWPLNILSEKIARFVQFNRQDVQRHSSAQNPHSLTRGPRFRATKFLQRPLCAVPRSVRGVAETLILCDAYYMALLSHSPFGHCSIPDAIYRCSDKRTPASERKFKRYSIAAMPLRQRSAIRALRAQSRRRIPVPLLQLAYEKAGAPRPALENLAGAGGVYCLSLGERNERWVYAGPDGGARRRRFACAEHHDQHSYRSDPDRLDRLQRRCDRQLKKTMDSAVGDSLTMGSGQRVLTQQYGVKPFMGQ